MASCCLEKIQSKVKRHDVYIYAFKVGEILNCSIENDNKYFENAIAVFSSSKKMVGYITEPLALHVFFIFMSLFFNVALFSCCTCSPCSLFMLQLHFFHIALSSYSTVSMLHFFPFTFFSCFILWMLLFFPAVPPSLFYRSQYRYE